MGRRCGVEKRDVIEDERIVDRGCGEELASDQRFEFLVHALFAGLTEPPDRVHLSRVQRFRSTRAVLDGRRCVATTGTSPRAASALTTNVRCWRAAYADVANLPHVGEAGGAFATPVSGQHDRARALRLAERRGVRDPKEPPPS